MPESKPSVSDTDAVLLAKIAGWLAVMACAFLVLCLCGGYMFTAAYHWYHITPGETFKTMATVCFTDLQALQEYVSASEVRDEWALRQLSDGGKILDVSFGTDVLALDRGSTLPLSSGARMSEINKFAALFFRKHASDEYRQYLGRAPKVRFLNGKHAGTACYYLHSGLLIRAGERIKLPPDATSEKSPPYFNEQDRQTIQSCLDRMRRRPNITGTGTASAVQWLSHGRVKVDFAGTRLQGSDGEHLTVTMVCTVDPSKTEPVTFTYRSSEE